MATGYGSWVGGDDYRAYVDIQLTSQNDTTGTFTVKSWMQTGAGGYASNLGSAIQGRARIWDKTAGYRNSSYVSLGTFGPNSWLTSWDTAFKTETFTVEKTHEAQTVYGYTQIVANSSASVYANTSSTAQATVTLPARASNTVTYDGNKPTAASGTVSDVPAAQTKWSGESMTLSTVSPTLANYRFKGWATSSLATTATYQPGATFDTDGATTLYAVWELSLVMPSITKVKLYRTETGNASTPVSNEYADGTYGYLEFAWAVDSATNGNTESSQHTVSVVTTDGTNTYTSSATVQGLSGTFKTNLKNGSTLLSSLSTGTSYTVRATFTDSKGASAAVSQTLSQSTFHIDVYASSNHRSIAFGREASESVDEIGFGSTFTPVFDDLGAWRSALGINGTVTTGSFSYTTTQGGWRYVQSISFGVTYDSLPIVMVTPSFNWVTNYDGNAKSANGITAVVSSTSTSGADITVWNYECPANNTVTFYWMAFGPLDQAASAPLPVSQDATTGVLNIG